MQSKRQTIVEVLTGITIGLIGSAIITYLCLTNLDQLTAFWMTITTTTLCTIWSLLRGYTIRRVFNRFNTLKGMDMIPKELIEIYKSGHEKLMAALAVRSAEVFNYPAKDVNVYAVPIGANIAIIDEIVKHRLVSDLPINDTTVSGLKTLNNVGLTGSTDIFKVTVYKNCHMSGEVEDNRFLDTQLYVFNPELMRMLDRYGRPGSNNGTGSSWVNIAHIVTKHGPTLRATYSLRGLDDEDVEIITLKDALSSLQMPDDHREILNKAAEILNTRLKENSNV